VGALFFVIAGFGWGKPVQVNPYALRPGRVGRDGLRGGGGPLANLGGGRRVVAVLFRGWCWPA
jgi:hypothetical protein